MRRKFIVPGMDEQSSGARIALARKLLGLSTTELLKTYGFSRSMISYTERGLNSPSPQLLFVLLKDYNISPAWILTGVGSMYHRISLADSGGDISVPIISPAGCGPGRTLEFTDETLQISQLYLSHLTNPVVCRAVGRSMAPHILPGDYAIIDRSESKRLTLDRKKTYLVNAPDTDEDVAISLKRVQLLNNSLRLIPANTADYTETVIEIDGTPLLNVILGTVALVIRDLEQIIQI